MENNQIQMKQKLVFFGILAQSVKLPFQNPKLIMVTFLTSLPLFCAILIHETIFQDALIEIGHELSSPRPYPYPYSCDNCLNGMPNPLDNPRVNYVVSELPRKLLVTALVYLGLVHLLDLFNACVIVTSASAIYSDGDKTWGVKEIFRRVPIKGPFLTSLYSLLLASLALLGLSSLGFHIYLSYADRNLYYIKVFFLPVFTLLLIKYMEWSAIWNTGIVVSVLDDQKQKYGDIALGVSGYISRGKRLCGGFLNAIFFAWKFGLRLMCLYVGMKSNGGGSNGLLAIVVAAFLVCASNVMKWVAFTVYFYDCKLRFLEKKADVEAGRRKTAEAVKLEFV